MLTYIFVDILAIYWLRIFYSILYRFYEDLCLDNSCGLEFYFVWKLRSSSNCGFGSRRAAILARDGFQFRHPDVFLYIIPPDDHFIRRYIYARWGFRHFDGQLGGINTCSNKDHPLIIDASLDAHYIYM